MIWTADERDGFYRNPILYEDFSDPDVCLGKGMTLRPFWTDIYR